MNILLNFYPVRAGGGQQVASNFLKIIGNNTFGHNWFVFVGSGSELDKLASSLISQNKILSLKYSYISRFFKNNEIKKYIDSHHIDIIYSYGPILSLSKNSVPQVLRSVYSNLYFPEIDFWGSYPKTIRLKKKIIDAFRLKQTLKANALIFENKSMQRRALKLFNYPKDRTKYIEPSVSIFDQETQLEKYNFLEHLNGFKILYLSSWHLNKRIDILPKVSKILKMNRLSVKFILSLDKNNPIIQENLVKEIKRLDVENYFEFIGKVNAISVHQVIKSSDAMILLSKLECFSSNVIEAFYYKKPLIISDEEWSRSACGDTAVYVNRDKPNDIAKSIIRLVKSKELQEKLRQWSQDRLKKFNTPEEKVRKQIRFLQYIHNEFKKKH